MHKLIGKLFGVKSEAVQAYETGAADVRTQLAAAARDIEAGEFDNAVINLLFAQEQLTDLRKEIELQAALASLRSAVQPS